MKTTIRIAATVSALAAAVASQAVVFTWNGQTTSGASSVGTFNTLPPAGPIGSGSPFSSITSGVVTLTGTNASSVRFTNGTDFVTVSFDGSVDNSTVTGLSSLSSVGTITAGTGVFASYVSATNQLTVTSNTYNALGYNFFSVLGNVNPVPEPASMAALAMGGLGLIARRRRKA